MSKNARLTGILLAALLSAVVLTGWTNGTHGGGQIPGSNVIDDLSNLVNDDLGNQVVAS